MQRSLTARRDGRRAIATVELAVILPVLAFMLVAGVDFARVFYYGVVLDGCARNGALNARVISADPTSPFTSVQAAALADATANGLSPAPTVAVGYSSAVGGPFTLTAPVSPGYVQVTVTWTFATLAQYPGVPSQSALSRACVMSVPPAVPVLN